jgi:hypothetical protein
MEEGGHVLAQRLSWRVIVSERERKAVAVQQNIGSSLGLFRWTP